MHDTPIVGPPPCRNNRPGPAEPKDEISADRRSGRRRGLTPRTVPQLRWFAGTIAVLVGLCLLFAAWVGAQILRAGL